MRPTPLRRARFRSAHRAAPSGDSFLPFTETGVPSSKPISTSAGLFGAFSGESDPLPHGFVRSVGGIFEHAAFMAQMPDIAVAAE